MNTIKSTKFFAASIVLALEHFHSIKLIYRDLKPENVLMDESGYICLTDFGLVRFGSSRKEDPGFLGTPDYVGKIKINKS